jgi:hypothetical protein
MLWLVDLFQSIDLVSQVLRFRVSMFVQSRKFIWRFMIQRHNLLWNYYRALAPPLRGFICLNLLVVILNIRKWTVVNVALQKW